MDYENDISALIKEINPVIFVYTEQEFDQLMDVLTERTDLVWGSGHIPNQYRAAIKSGMCLVLNPDTKAIVYGGNLSEYTIKGGYNNGYNQFQIYTVPLLCNLIRSNSLLDYHIAKMESEKIEEEKEIITEYKPMTAFKCYSEFNIQVVLNYLHKHNLKWRSGDPTNDRYMLEELNSMISDKGTLYIMITKYNNILCACEALPNYNIIEPEEYYPVMVEK